MATSDAPLSIGSITLVVNNLDRMFDFYHNVLGLNEISRDASSCAMGQGDKVLLKLIVDRNARSYPREAGLFHTAFLLPERADLGSWLKHTKATGVKLDGAADHQVSEAVYLTDPEGNGVEVYADRDRSAWTVTNGLVELRSGRLDFSRLEAASTNSWDALPKGSVIGHVHLQVGNISEADAFYRDTLGLDRTAVLDHAGFYGSGGYHHHIAGNIWNSPNAGQRPVDATGFYEMELVQKEHLLDFEEIDDPWGMKITLSQPAL